METPLQSAPKPRMQVIPWYTLGGAGVLGLAVALSVQPQTVQAAGLAQGAGGAASNRPARTPIVLSAPVLARPVSAVPTTVGETLEITEPSTEDELGLR
ncbi:MAG: hypothetical protein ACI8QC_000753 [Planctomycetota bacterium]|jgi:hypothetical protein